MNSNSNETPTSDDSFDKEDYMESGLKDHKGELFAGKLTDYEHREDSCEFRCDNRVKLAVRAHSPEVLQFTYSADGHLGDDFSYAVLADAFPDKSPLEVTENKQEIVVKTSAMKVSLARKNLQMSIQDSAGKVLSEDEKGFHWEKNEEFGGNVVKYSRKTSKSEVFYGLGDKSSHPEMTGLRFELWGSDTYAYGKDTDPLYKNIPFFIGIKDGQAYGVFFDNTFRSFFDFGKERKSTTSFWAHGGLMNFYFIAGPTVADVVKRFAQLTGVPELPPLWALGYHQCKWSYKTEEEFTNLALGFLNHKIPCDALYVDIDYMDGYRCFTWNLQSFPKPGEMIRELERKGFKTVAIIDPGIKVDDGYSIYEEGIEGDHFCRQMDGDIYTGKVWPGDCHFPDFTAERTRIWWSGLFKGLIEDDGIAGIWNDMNEPADFNESKTFPRHIRHDYDGHPCSHRKAHNVYGTEMIKATRAGVARFNGGKRPFAITRSAYAGAWRYASAWTGDNISTWEHLRIANLQCQRLSLSGYSFVGSDIGGFLDKTNGELYTRWVQLGIFHPFCRTHSSGEHGNQEPWSFGEPYTSICRKFIELRYRLLPYFYSAFHQHIASGEPMLRPLVYIDSQDTETYHRVDEFGVGEHLMVCPIQKKKGTSRKMYLPRGRSYYNFWNEELVQGGKEFTAQASLEQIPFYVQAGTVLPLDPVRQYSWEKVDEARELRVYLPEVDAEPLVSKVYDDSGDHYGYQEGDFCETTYTTHRPDEDRIIISASRSGNREPIASSLTLAGLGAKKAKVQVDGEDFPLSDDTLLPANFTEIVITLS